MAKSISISGSGLLVGVAGISVGKGDGVLVGGTAVGDGIGELVGGSAVGAGSVFAGATAASDGGVQAVIETAAKINRITSTGFT
jgi:hypothetical protein